MRSVELFTGCGGLAMGLSKAGFKAVRMVEWDRHSVSNVIHNRARGIEHVRDWPIVQEDVRAIDWRDYKVHRPCRWWAPMPTVFNRWET